MKKNFLMTLALAAVMSLTLGGAVSAHCGKCPGDIATKKECKTDQACCKYGKASMDAEKALKEDLTKLEKGVSPVEQAEFLRVHQGNLKKYFDAKAECQKECAAMGDKSKRACSSSTEKETRG